MPPPHCDNLGLSLQIQMNTYLLESAVTARLEEASDFRVIGRNADRLLGAYYTHSGAADAMSRWVIRASCDKVLEPSFGDGAFLRAVKRASKDLGLERIQLYGAELVHEPFAAALKARLLPPKNAFLTDFLALEPFTVDAVIGNPPYVRLRHLPKVQMTRALHCALTVLGQDMETSGSVWMPFVLHCLRFLRPGGRLSLVLPHELTYVRYARPLWKKLGESFSDLRLVRVHERLFPEILQEVVLLFADGYGGQTQTVRYQTYERASQFTESDGGPFASLPLEDIIAGKRVFLEALLPASTRSLISRILTESTVPIPDLCSFNIGYVAGDNRFFHPSALTIREYSLPKSHLRISLTSGKQIRSCGLRTSNLQCIPERLYFPSLDKKKLTTADLRYISSGEKQYVHKRYKCKVRKPWYIVPGVRIPGLVLSVFTERPVLVINDAKYLASNSFLCGYLRKGTPEGFAAAWYTSLTLLQVELQVHALGGGLLVLVPGEVGNIRLPICKPTKSQLRCVDCQTTKGDIEAAYQCGDTTVLQKQLGLSFSEVADLRSAIDILRHWRNSANGGLPGFYSEDSK